MSDPFAPPLASLQEVGTPPRPRFRNALIAALSAPLGPVLLVLALVHFTDAWVSDVQYFGAVAVFLLSMLLTGLLVLPFRRMSAWLVLLLGPALGTVAMCAIILAWKFVSEN